MLFHQFHDKTSGTYTYLLADEKSKEAILIDTVRDDTQDYLDYLQTHGLTLLYLLETHIHADHITGAAMLRMQTGAKIAYSKSSGVNGADMLLSNGDTITIGKHKIKAISTPGHTEGCMSFLAKDMVFTGDALLIGKVGRTDFQEGNAKTLYDSITKHLFTLPDTTLVYPAHDYEGKTSTTIGEQKRHNVRIANKTKEEFVAIMESLHLPPPSKIDEAVPSNMHCGED